MTTPAEPAAPPPVEPPSLPYWPRAGVYMTGTSALLIVYALIMFARIDAISPPGTGTPGGLILLALLMFLLIVLGAVLLVVGLITLVVQIVRHPSPR